MASLNTNMSVLMDQTTRRAVEHLTKAVEHLTKAAENLAKAIEKSNQIEIQKLRDQRALHGGSTTLIDFEGEEDATQP